MLDTNLRFQYKLDISNYKIFGPFDKVSYIHYKLSQH